LPPSAVTTPAPPTPNTLGAESGAPSSFRLSVSAVACAIALALLQ
jgi:hypothetical protein